MFERIGVLVVALSPLVACDTAPSGPTMVGGPIAQVAPGMPAAVPMAPVVAPATALTPVAMQPLAAAPAAGPSSALPPAAAAAVARFRQIVAAQDLAALQPLLMDQGTFAVGPGLTANTPPAAIAAWRANPALLAELAGILGQPCSSEVDDDQVFVTCPAAAADDDYEGPQAMLAEMDEGVFELASFERP